MTGRFRRDRLTWIAYVLLAWFAYLQAAPGLVIGHLRDELHLSYSTGGLYVAAFAAGKDVLLEKPMAPDVDFDGLGERTIYVDCDVLQADGGTRCASITGAWVALFAAGHRIRVDITSSSHPRWDRNLNTSHPVGTDSLSDRVVGLHEVASTIVDVSPFSTNGALVLASAAESAAFDARTSSAAR